MPGSFICPWWKWPEYLGLPGIALPCASHLDFLVAWQTWVIRLLAWWLASHRASVLRRPEGMPVLLQTRPRTDHWPTSLLLHIIFKSSHRPAWESDESGSTSQQGKWHTLTGREGTMVGILEMNYCTVLKEEHGYRCVRKPTWLI